MEINGVKIQVPEGMEYYIEDGEIRFRKKISLDEIYEQLFLNKTIYYMSDTGFAHERRDFDSIIPYDIRTIANNCTSSKQVEKLCAIIKLMNVAKYLNGDWNPNWENDSEKKYYIKCFSKDNEVLVDYVFRYNYPVVYFRTKDLAQRAIDILGEETIKLALSTDW